MQQWFEEITEDIKQLGFKKVDNQLVGRVDEESLDRLAFVISKKLDLVKNGPLNIWLEGDLGSGKTTFTKKFAKHIGCKNEIKSPSFNKINVHKLGNNKSFHHIDLYLAKEKDMESIFEWTTYGFVVCIEWPSKFKDLLSKNKMPALLVNINHCKEPSWRIVTITTSLHT